MIELAYAGLAIGVIVNSYACWYMFQLPEAKNYHQASSREHGEEVGPLAHEERQLTAVNGPHRAVNNDVQANLKAPLVD